LNLHLPIISVLIITAIVSSIPFHSDCPFLVALSIFSNVYMALYISTIHASNKPCYFRSTDY